ncbi:MAG: hypothetical protein ACSLFA_02635 [Mycobacterium sp.]
MRTIRNAAHCARAAGAAAIALGALFAGTPVAHAATLQQICQLDPSALDSEATRSVYRSERRGNDRVHLCELYDAASVHLGTYTEVDYGWYRKADVAPRPVPAPAVRK